MEMKRVNLSMQFAWQIYKRIGDKSKALEFAQRATTLTPNLFSAYLVEMQVLTKLNGSEESVTRIIEKMQKIIDDKSSGEGRTNLPQYLNAKAGYLLDQGKIQDAISIIRANERRLGALAKQLKKRISYEIKDLTKINSNDRSWLKLG